MLKMQTVEEIAIDPKALRQAFGTFVTGVTVVTTIDKQGRPRGMTVNSFTSVSLDPPLLLVCIGKSAQSYPAFASADSFAVNILHEGQAEISRVFASKSQQKFSSVSCDKVHTGAPVLSDSLAWFDCSLHSRVEAGDHIILIGHVQAFGTSTAAPLGFCRGSYVRVDDPLPSGWPKAHGMIVSYLIETEQGLLLREDGKGGLVLPSARRRRPEAQLHIEGSTNLQLYPETTFLYSIFDMADNDPGQVVYRARLAEELPPEAHSDGLRVFGFDDIPYDAIPTSELRSVLRRYVRERRDGRFSIYVDSDDGGRVALIDGDLREWAQHQNTPL
ncbi:MULTISPECIES: flavin reductase [Chelativorans]|jgi:flavin reductase (DIM6/NTAB) family NADH-FMN oxidoreductase RutF|nr:MULTISPECIES: flavin reductase family protein [Chelativorans]